ncbi:LacI family DNA-binding transcriptional regulator [Roseovarius sp. C7]|uniref:LacI family DNA-binding transcriptional regulator n=1 Tax=Roseovarius sp. C7 TaxID=3398643 RepID=UPI0039F6F2F5
MTRDKNILGQRPRRVTAQTVADRAGVSRSAVSRAFTKGAYLDAEKRRKILSVAAEIGYQPNALAAGLKGGNSHLVAIFVGDLRNPYDTAFVSQLVGALNAIKKWPLLIDGNDARAATALEEVLRYPLDALILRGGSLSGEIVDQCARYGIPMISSGRPITAPGVDTVCCRNAQGARMGTELLLGRGRRRIGYLGGPPELYSSCERRAGVMAALEAADLVAVAEATGDYTVDGGHVAARALLQGTEEIDALVCANDAMAIGALSAARDLGRQVPGDLAVIGFDDIDMAKWQSFDLTTVRNPIDAAVTEILRLLEARLDDPGKADEMVFVDPVVKPRGTH